MPEIDPVKKAPAVNPPHDPIHEQVMHAFKTLTHFLNTGGQSLGVQPMQGPQDLPRFIGQAASIPGVMPVGAMVPEIPKQMPYVSMWPSEGIAGSVGKVLKETRGQPEAALQKLKFFTPKARNAEFWIKADILKRMMVGQATPEEVAWFNAMKGKK